MIDTHSVYIARDLQGQVLYVGYTARGIRRIREHTREKEWIREVATIELHHFDTEEEGRAHEAVMIRELHPRYNVMLNRVAGFVILTPPTPEPQPQPAPEPEPSPYLSDPEVYALFGAFRQQTLRRIVTEGPCPISWVEVAGEIRIPRNYLISLEADP